ncbi:MAG TPA: SH3 domain-containing protein [Anaerolineaceae bacterium]
MKRFLVVSSLLLLTISLILLSSEIIPVAAHNAAQQPTIALATVTGTPSGPMVTVLPGNEEQVNVRSGPGVFYPKVGVLLVGQKVPAKGRSPGGDWILVEYPGVQGGTAWVYAPFVRIVPATELPVVAPPPSPTPLYTLTIDPTLAAQFIVTPVPSRLPTYTAPPPLVIPTYPVEATGQADKKIPLGMVIIGLASLGLLLGLISFTQR